MHISFGTDITHQHPSFPAARAGELTMKDFRILAHRVGKAFDGGVVIVFGSAVILPEVFLKAVSVARNLGANLDAMTTANFDMIRHYRPRQNVVTRPVSAGRGHEVVGHHEILLPLLRQAVIEGLASTGTP